MPFTIKKPEMKFNASYPNRVTFTSSIYLSDMKRMRDGDSDCRYEIIINYINPDKKDNTLELIINRAGKRELRKEIHVNYVNDTIIQANMIREFGNYIKKSLPIQDIFIK